MKFDLFRTYSFDKKVDMRHNYTGKQMNLSPSDLCFLHKGHFDLIDTATLMSGVFVCYRSTSNNPGFYAPWIKKTCFHSNNDMSYIYRLVKRPGNIPDWATYDYFIMDASGKILFKNIEIDKTIDKNGVIHLSSPEHDLDELVYPAERKKYSYKHHFCHGREFKELNRQIVGMVDSKIIKTPKNFKKGFSKGESLEKE